MSFLSLFRFHSLIQGMMPDKTGFDLPSVTFYGRDYAILDSAFLTIILFVNVFLLVLLQFLQQISQNIMR